jgi:hypothetical protein
MYKPDGIIDIWVVCAIRIHAICLRVIYLIRLLPNRVKRLKRLSFLAAFLFWLTQPLWRGLCRQLFLPFALYISQIVIPLRTIDAFAAFHIANAGVSVSTWPSLVSDPFL